MDEEVEIVLDSRYKGRPYASETLGGFLIVWVFILSLYFLYFLVSYISLKKRRTEGGILSKNLHSRLV